MASLGDLKTRIRLETNRDDIASDGEAVAALTLAIERAIEHFADEPFWFANDAGTVSTVSGENTVVRPYAVRVAKIVSYSGTPLTKVPLERIEHRTETGQPCQWAENGDFIQLYPVPNGVYSLSVYGTAQLDAPESDTDETVWTNEAYDLIAARTRFLLYRDIWRDVEGTQLAAQAEGEALSALRKKTRRRGVTPLTTDLPPQTRYDITTDF